MSFTTGLPTWTWPDWRKYPRGTRVRHNDSGRYGTYIKPSKVRHDGAVIRWDAYGAFPAIERKVIAPARDLTPVRITAWELIGFDSTSESVSDEEIAKAIGPRTVGVRMVGGRATYEAVLYNDETARSDNVKLARLEPQQGGIREVSRYVDPVVELEFVEVGND